MKAKFVFTKKRLIGFLCLVSFPVLAIGIGIFLLAKGLVLTVELAIIHILLPLVTAGLLALCVFSGRKKILSGVISGVILGLFIVLFAGSAAFADYVQVKHYDGAKAKERYTAAMAEQPYRAAQIASTLMPELSEIGQPFDIGYGHVWQSAFIFSSDADFLICHYTPEEYEIQKAALDTEYVFQTEGIPNQHSDGQPSAEVDGYQFRFLSIEEYEVTIDYPKHVILIGYSDKAHKIVYILYNDTDLDYIPSLEDFILDYCGWKYVR